tara:strand:- start:208 stop:474 length:267 start_codon:yes stop_codon:yes gene_type:complete
MTIDDNEWEETKSEEAETADERLRNEMQILNRSSMNKFEEYTVNVSFVMSVSARSRTEARVNVINKLQFPGDIIANLIVTVKDLPDDQ